MSVTVIFPDGTQRRVMAELRLDTHAASGTHAGRFVQCPINADPRWKYVRRNGQWIARPRFGSLRMTAMKDTPTWWDGITIMADDNGVSARNDMIGPHRHAA